MLNYRPVLAFLASGALIAASAGLGYASAKAQRAAAQQEEKPAPAQPKLRQPTDAERKAATGAIEAQLKAFKANDYEKAAKFQSEGLRKGIPDAEAFKRMMKQSYPQFASYKSVTFGDARCTEKGDMLQVQVTLTGTDGIMVRALYVMVLEEGEWRIGSVLGGIPAKVSPKEVVRGAARDT